MKRGAAVHLAVLLGPYVAIAGVPDAAMIVLAVLATTWCVVEGSLERPERSAVRVMAAGPAWLPRMAGLAVLAVVLASIVEHALRGTPVPGAAIAAGATLMLAGMALRVASIRALREWFLDEVAVVRSQPLVTGGLYGRVRHPSELGTICLVIGAAVVTGSVWGGVIACCLVTPCSLWRARLEDALLARRYGASFRRYARSVPALLPRPA